MRPSIRPGPCSTPTRRDPLPAGCAAAIVRTGIGTSPAAPGSAHPIIVGTAENEDEGQHREMVASRCADPGAFADADVHSAPHKGFRMQKVRPRLRPALPRRDNPIELWARCQPRLCALWYQPQAGTPIGPAVARQHRCYSAVANVSLTAAPRPRCRARGPSCARSSRAPYRVPRHSPRRPKRAGPLRNRC